MAIFVVAHGAWSSAWAWKRMRPLMAAGGHSLYIPTYTGLGARRHLVSPAVDLDTHIADVIGHLEMEDLTDVVLVGHSYGGMVATGVADRARARIARLVYLDAFVPRDGQSVLDLQKPEGRATYERQAAEHGFGWLIPPSQPPADTSPEDVAWMAPRRAPQPIATFRQRLALVNGEPSMPRHYIFCSKVSPADTFRPFMERARSEPGWTLTTLDASHNPHITMPDRLMTVLAALAGGAAPG